MRRLYFAYGSNINLEQMAFRCPRAEVVGPVTLDNYELLFRGNHTHFGVATIRPKEGSQVPGLLWELTPACEQSLDRYEGYPSFYEKETVSVRDREGNIIPCMVYVMTRERMRSPALPSQSYYEGIRQGYQENGLPLEALDQAVDFACVEVAVRDQQVRQENFFHKAQSKKGGKNYEAR